MADPFFAAPPLFAAGPLSCDGLRVEAHRQPPRNSRAACWSPAYILHVHEGADLRMRGTCCGDRLDEIFRRDGLFVAPPRSGTTLEWDGTYAFTRVRLGATLVERAADDLNLRLAHAAAVAGRAFEPGAVHTARALLEAARAPQPPALLVDALTTVLASAVARMIAGKPAPERVRGLPRHARNRVLALIEDRLDVPISLDELATAAGLSRYHFLRCFRASTGTTPHRYVLARRVERARTLLRGTRIPITEIALHCGFASASHLAAQFRRSTGATPSEYRAAH
jgi:AraC-like DNA-binding protein